MDITLEQFRSLSPQDQEIVKAAQRSQLGAPRTPSYYSSPATNRFSSSSNLQPSSAYNPDIPETFDQRVSRIGNLALEKAGRAKDAVVTSTQNLVPRLQRAGFTSRNVGGVGAVGAGLLTASQQAGQDQTVGAIASIPGSIIGGGVFSAGVNAFTKGMPGIGGTILRTVVPIAGAMGVGNIFAAGAEAGKNLVTGEQIGKKPETAKAGPPSYIPGTNIPLNESARMLALKGAVGQQDLEMYKQQTATDMAFNRQMMQYQLESDMQRMKSQMPYIDKLKNDDLVRSQALLNTQGNVDARLGMLATQGALAKGAQAEAGAFARTAISTNPYANAATRQSPNIQFG